jgi:hypothetical protein
MPSPSHLVRYQVVMKLTPTYSHEPVLRLKDASDRLQRTISRAIEVTNDAALLDALRVRWAATQSSTDGSANDAQEPATVSPHEKSSIPPDEHGPKEPTFATSQRLWNAAYDGLENNEAELVGSYVKVLEAVLCSEASKDPASDVASVAAELKDPSQRQAQMQKLVKEALAKIAKASKIANGAGDFVEAILSVKPMVDLAIQDMPQAAPAALPWAGVCIGLQVSLLFLNCLVSVLADIR